MTLTSAIRQWIVSVPPGLPSILEIEEEEFVEDLRWATEVQQLLLKDSWYVTNAPLSVERLRRKLGKCVDSSGKCVDSSGGTGGAFTPVAPRNVSSPEDVKIVDSSSILINCSSPEQSGDTSSSGKSSSPEELERDNIYGISLNLTALEASDGLIDTRLPGKLVECIENTSNGRSLIGSIGPVDLSTGSPADEYDSNSNTYEIFYNSKCIGESNHDQPVSKFSIVECSSDEFESDDSSSLVSDTSADMHLESNDIVTKRVNTDISSFVSKSTLLHPDDTSRKDDRSLVEKSILPVPSNSPSSNEPSECLEINNDEKVNVLGSMKKMNTINNEIVESGSSDTNISETSKSPETVPDTCLTINENISNNLSDANSHLHMVDRKSLASNRAKLKLDKNNPVSVSDDKRRNHVVNKPVREICLPKVDNRNTKKCNRKNILLPVHQKDFKISNGSEQRQKIAVEKNSKAIVKDENNKGKNSVGANKSRKIFRSKATNKLKIVNKAEPKVSVSSKDTSAHSVELSNSFASKSYSELSAVLNLIKKVKKSPVNTEKVGKKKSFHIIHQDRHQQSRLRGRYLIYSYCVWTNDYIFYAH